MSGHTLAPPPADLAYYPRCTIDQREILTGISPFEVVSTVPSTVRHRTDMSQDCHSGLFDMTKLNDIEVGLGPVKIKLTSMCPGLSFPRFTVQQLCKFTLAETLAHLLAISEAGVKRCSLFGVQPLPIFNASRLRDAGFNTIWVSEVLYKFQVEDGDSARTIIKAITSKGSVKYTRASMSYNTKGEGAREYLGSLEM